MADPSDMILFATVVRERGLTAAAKALGISKQSVSHRVQRLEQSLGVRLLERTTRQIRPTEAGALYAERCAELATRIEDADREAQARHLEPAGSLRVSSPVAFGRRVLVPVLDALLARHPALAVDLVLTDRMVRVMEEGFDVAIRTGALPDSSLVARRLGDVRLEVFASPQHLARHGRPRTVADLASASCLGTQAVERWVLGRSTVRVRPRLVINDLDALLAATVRGLGVARLPDRLAADALEAGALTRLFPRMTVPAGAVHAVMPAGRYQPAKVRVFVDEVQRAMRD